ncbi:MAG: formimidoylglutamate deiminase [Chloroflexota bacterium]
MTTPLIQIDNTHFVVSGLATAHSHAFQRALRGHTQRRQMDAASFWSWRGLMYRLAGQLDPDTMYAIARFAYTELAMSDVTAVGEFHYVHHQPNGKPYASRTILAEAVIQAAKDVGIRICLIRTAYLRAGYQQDIAAGQQRFVDPSIESALGDVEHLQSMFADDPLVKVAVAAHSIRAVPIEQIKVLAEYTTQYQLPFHMHICEQRRELEECQAEYGTTPVDLLADQGILSPRFVGTHATHLQPSEIEALGGAQVFICLCRTTERDLGDGLPQTADLVQAGVKLCVGVDSHASSDAFEEIRAIELDDRSRTETRHVAAEAPALLAAATGNGYAAIGFEANLEDRVYLNVQDPSLIGIDYALATDGIIFGANPRAVDKVRVNGQQIVEGGQHKTYDEARIGYQQALRQLALLS